ncbi:MAG: histidine phosphatase family protein [Acutalibacteraceae bacterium]|jgi:alpha-ribazole phosphatase
MQSYKIHLIRHGETQANAEGRYVGRTDEPLSPRGLTRLLQMKERYGYPGAGRFYSSPLTRCRQTLQVLYPGCQPKVVPGLAECDFGEWEGKSVISLKQDPRFGRWLSGEEDVIPGGESGQEFQQRVSAAFEAVVDEMFHTGTTEAVICTHGGVIMMLMAAYALPRAPMHEWAAENGGGFTLRITPTLWLREPVAEAIETLPLIRSDQKEG